MCPDKDKMLHLNFLMRPKCSIIWIINTPVSTAILHNNAAVFEDSKRNSSHVVLYEKFKAKHPDIKAKKRGEERVALRN